MKFSHFGALALMVGLCVAPTLRAQQIQPTEGTRFGLGLGATMPMGNYGDVDKLGYNLIGVLQLPLANSPVHLRIDGMYSQTSHDGIDGSTDLLGGTVSALYHLGDRIASTRPYILGGLGFFNVDPGVGGSETKIAFSFGGGALFSLAGFNAFAEARYVSVQTSGASVSFIPVSVGLMFGY